MSQQPDVDMLLAQLEEAEALIVGLRNRAATLNAALKAEHTRAAALEHELEKLAAQQQTPAAAVRDLAGQDTAAAPS